MRVGGVEGPRASGGSTHRALLDPAIGKGRGAFTGNGGLVHLGAMAQGRASSID